MEALPEGLQKQLFALAYRMLGTVADAEDAVQDTWVRWLRRPQTSDVASPKAFLMTTATRLCIDRLRTLKRDRDNYEGTWLPEPLVESSPTAQRAELASSLSPAFLMILETLNPVERAVLLLRDVFECEYAAVAEVIEKSESNCRQIGKRARQRVREAPRWTADPDAADALASRFFVAAATGDTGALVELLHEDVVAWTDHGGKAAAARNTMVGRDNVARYLIGSAKKFAQGLRPVFATVNGRPGVVLYDNCDAVHAVLFVEVDGDQIVGFGTIRNPDKLALVPHLD